MDPKSENLDTKSFLFNSLSLFLKVIVVIFVVYFAICYALAGLDNKDFSYTTSNPIQIHTTILLQPIMDIFGYSKISHWYNYSQIDKAKIPQNILPLNISGDSNVRKLDQQLFWSNTAVSLGKVDQAVIIEPANFSGKWSLVFCIKDSDFCQESNIVTKGAVKLIADGQQQAWGKDEQGNFIQLKLDRYINRGDYPTILHI